MVQVVVDGGEPRLEGPGLIQGQTSAVPAHSSFSADAHGVLDLVRCGRSPVGVLDGGPGLVAGEAFALGSRQRLGGAVEGRIEASEAQQLLVLLGELQQLLCDVS